MAHEFLSPEWIAAVRELREQHPEAGSSIPLAVRMNLVVTEGPSGTLSHAHVDTSAGALMVEEGHLVEPERHHRIPCFEDRLIPVSWPLYFLPLNGSGHERRVPALPRQAAIKYQGVVRQLGEPRDQERRRIRHSHPHHSE